MKKIIIFILAFTLSLISCYSVFAIVELPITYKTQVNHYDLDGVTGTALVDLIGTENLTCNNLDGDEFEARANFGNALHLNGVDEFCNDNTFASGVSQGTICWWVNFDVVTDQQDVIWAKNTGGDVLWEKYDATGGFFNIATTYVIPYTSAENGLWNFMCETYDGTTHKAYKNGTLVDSHNSTSVLIGNGKFSIGSYYNSAKPIDALIDDVVIFSDVLTLEEIQYIYSYGNIPTISQESYNVTSGYGNTTIWRTALNLNVNTTDSTPSINFTLDLASNCSIGNTDRNYTNMTTNDSNTKCATTETTGMTCTLPSTQQLSVGNNTIYIACRSATSENSSSTSGALKLFYNAPPVKPDLSSPPNASTITSATTSLIWNTTELNGDSLYYWVFASTNLSNVTSTPYWNGDVNSTTKGGLLDGETWYWFVIASDNTTNSSNSSTYQFDVSIGVYSSSTSGAIIYTSEETSSDNKTYCGNIADKLKKSVVDVLFEFTIEKFTEVLKLLHDFIICHTFTTIGDI